MIGKGKKRRILLTYIQLSGGALSVMVTVLESGRSTWVRIQNEAVCIWHSANTLGKGIDRIIFPPAMDK